MKVMEWENYPQRLKFLEALSILQHRPSLNSVNEITLLPSLTQRIQIGSRGSDNLPIQSQRTSHETGRTVTEPAANQNSTHSTSPPTNENSGAPIATRTRSSFR